VAVAAALVTGYVWAQRRRRRAVTRFTNLALLERVAPAMPERHRHLPMALVLVALALRIVTLAGPMADSKVARNRATVMLAIDVSLSMEATDVSPTRLATRRQRRSRSPTI
jgi:Ca-activated chloride channel family protein